MSPVTKSQERFAWIAGITAIFCLVTVTLLPHGSGETSTTRDSISVEIVETAPDATDDPNIRNTGEVWIELFESAENTIDIEAPYFHHSIIGEYSNVVDSLQAAAENGVQIRILTNDWTTGLNSLAEEPSVEVLTPSDGDLAIHGKYFIVDNRKVFVGSQNWSWTAIGNNHELGLLIENEQIANTYTYIFESGWQEAGGEERGAGYWEADWIYPVASGPAMPQEVRPTLSVLENIIDSAQKSVRVYIYVFSTGSGVEPLATALRSAAERGVDVQLMTDAWYYPDLWPDKSLSSYGFSETLEELAEVEGIEVKTIYLDQYSRAHQKIVVADGERAYVGSANWTSSSLYNRREVGVAFEDSTLAAALSDSLDAYWSSEYARSVGETPTPNNPPTASFTYSPSSPTTDDTISFSDESTDSDGTIASRSWDFGDGTPTSTSQNPPHQYTSAGTYTITLTVTDDDGATDSSSGYTTITTPTNTAPDLSSGSVSPSSGTTGTTFTYEVTYTDVDGDAPSYVKVYIDDVSYSMSKVSGTYAGGALHQYTTTLETGSHSYYFEASDGTNTTRLPTSGTYLGPTVTEGEAPEDADNDGMPDTWENQYGLNPNLNDASQDKDGDGYTNLQEYQAGTDPTLASSYPGALGDSDSDGMPDNWETQHGLDPNDSSDADADPDGDAYTNLQEYQAGTDPNDATSYPGAPSFEITLTFTRQDATPLVNATIYYSTSKGQENVYLGTTDSEGRVTSTDSDLAGQVVYFKSSDGEYAGSLSLGSSGGQQTVSMLEVEAEEVGGVPLTYLLVAGITAVAVILALALYMKSKGKPEEEVEERPEEGEPPEEKEEKPPEKEEKPPEEEEDVWW